MILALPNCDGLVSRPAPWDARPMSDTPPGLSNLPEFSVAEISAAVKSVVEGGFQHVRVRGEISRPKIPSSGHLYLTLKDDRAVLDAVCWRGTVARLGLRPEDGMEVICTGRLTTYAGQSKYQMVIERMELAGEGALLKLLEDRKKRLAAEGLFDPARKRAVPMLPAVIGVVTSPSGAAIRDILHRIQDRCPRRVLLWPVPVQGEAAAARIAEAIQGFPDAAPRPEVLIVGRGGGSLEDLMAFNEEVVVRAVARCPIPVIAAVGHETDTTLIDLAADLRAPTPTAAAELAVPVRADLMARLAEADSRRLGAMTRAVGERRARVEGLARGLADPVRLLEGMAQRLDHRGERLDQALRLGLERRTARLHQICGRLVHPRQRLADEARRLARLRLPAAALSERLDRHGQGLVEWQRRLDGAAARALEGLRARLDRAGRLLETLSYKRTLARGFAVVRGRDGAVIRHAAAIEAGSEYRLELANGDAAVIGAGTPKPAPEPAPKAKKPAAARRPTPQASLFDATDP